MAADVIQPIRRILFPTDFSPAAQAAFAHAERLALGTGASLLVLHVFDMPDFWGTCGRPDEVDAEIKQKLSLISTNSPDVCVEYVAHGGSAGEVICWVAQERECDQIVMGTHGHSGLGHLLLGSVAEYVVRHAPCPVLVVRQRSEHEKPLKEPEIHLPMPPIL